MEQVLEYIKRAHQGDKAARDLLVQNNLGLVWSIVRRFSNRGYDPEDLQCLRDPAEPYFLDRVVYHRDAGDEGAEVDHADAKNFKLRDGYVEAGPAE
mgnify:FL=1